MRAFAEATSGEAKPLWRRLGDLALVTAPAEKTLIEWVARHPLLSIADLAALPQRTSRTDRAPPGAAREQRRDPSRQRTREDERYSQMNNVNEPRYVLTELGMRLLAAQAGVPPAVFGRYGGVTFASARQPSRQRVVWHREHTLGVNRFAARLALDARAAGWRFAEWRNEAESTHHFVSEDGRRAWIRPDGSGLLVRGAEVRPFLFEYDRGTINPAPTARSSRDTGSTTPPRRGRRISRASPRCSSCAAMTARKHGSGELRAGGRSRPRYSPPLNGGSRAVPATCVACSVISGSR